MEMSFAEGVIWRRRTCELGIEPKLDRRLEGVERRGNRLHVEFKSELTDEGVDGRTERPDVHRGGEVHC